MWETFTEPGTGPSPHVHVRETEVFRVISGRYRFWCGETCFDGGPGTTVTLPPLVPHAWRNIGDTPGQMFAIVTPGGTGYGMRRPDGQRVLRRRYRVKAQRPGIAVQQIRQGQGPKAAAGPAEPLAA